MGLGVCVLCCVVLPQVAQRAGGGGGAEERQKGNMYRKFGNLRPLNAANTRGNHQKGFLCVFMSMGV